MNKNWLFANVGIKCYLKEFWLLMIFVIVLSFCFSTEVRANSGTSGKAGSDQVKSELQQDKVIRGKVTDALTGESLPGVNIAIVGTSIGTTTDINGEYTLVVPDKNASIMFSFVGYTNENVVVGTKSIINVQLNLSTTELEETVVIGYQEVHKKRVTASVVSVPSEVISEIPAASISTLLSGKAAGVQNLVRSGAPVWAEESFKSGGTPMCPAIWMW